MKRWTTYLFIIILIIPIAVLSQDDSSNNKDTLYQKLNRNSERDLQKQFIIEQSIETIAENTEDEEIDFTTLFDLLSFYYEHPINLNKKDMIYDLEQLRLLNQFQINAISDHIAKHGKLITVYELQTIDQLNQNEIRTLLPFIIVSSNFDAPNISFTQMLIRGKNDLFIRYSRVLEETNGQREVDDSTWLNSRNTIQVGSPDNIYLRYRFKYQNNLSIGLTMEKDAGETMISNKKAFELFDQKTTTGFDYYSAHFFLRNVGKFKALAFGDYHVQIGQGLTFWSGLAFGKSSDIMGIKRNAVGLRPYASVDENLFLRGAAFEIQWKKFNLLTFGSDKNIDANIQQDTSSTDGDITVSSFQASGIHSTISEIEDKDVLKETVFGTEVSYIDKKLKIGLASAITQYHGDLKRNLVPYSQFQFNSNINWVSGANYNWLFQNFNFFGEISRSDNGGVAQLHGMLASLHPRVSISSFYRNYGRDYQSVFSNAFAESSTNINEKGILTGLNLKLSNKWTISTYFDQFSFQWMRYQVDAPNTNGVDVFSQLKYRPHKKMEIYLVMLMLNIY